MAAGLFPGFGPAAYRFFAELGANNTKAWFEANRAAYDREVKVPVSARERIRVHPDRFLSMQGALDAAGLTLDGTDHLTRMPRGFEDLKDSPVSAALRLRSFMVRRDLPPNVVAGPALVGAIAGFAETALPLLRFGWDAVDEAGQA